MPQIGEAAKRVGIGVDTIRFYERQGLIPEPKRTKAIARGEKIWLKYCVSCHGKDGQGTGDAYLFWSLSEGGAIEPFKSLGSRMPPFKDVLSESERWDVLAYVHAFFHQGLIHWTLPIHPSGIEDSGFEQD